MNLRFEEATPEVADMDSMINHFTTMVNESEDSVL